MQLFVPENCFNYCSLVSNKKLFRFSPRSAQCNMSITSFKMASKWQMIHWEKFVELSLWLHRTPKKSQKQIRQRSPKATNKAVFSKSRAQYFPYIYITDNSLKRNNVIQRGLFKDENFTYLSCYFFLSFEKLFHCSVEN